MTAVKVDRARELKELYAPGRRPSLVDVPEMSFLMIDGHGDPNVAAEYAQAVEALYSVSYTLKFMLKRGPQQIDYKVMPLEGLWWVPVMAAFSTSRKEDWDWTMMIAQPDEVDDDMAAQAVATAAAKKDLPAAPLVRLERFAEGRAAQVLHLGPYADEGPTIEGLHAFIADQGLERAGKHHEIYLGDPRRTAPERLKTVVRQPVASPG
jgi:hypothetical protein